MSTITTSGNESTLTFSGFKGIYKQLTLSERAWNLHTTQYENSFQMRDDRTLTAYRTIQDGIQPGQAGGPQPIALLSFHHHFIDGCQDGQSLSGSVVERRSSVYVGLSLICEVIAWISIAVLGHQLTDTQSHIEKSVCCDIVGTSVKWVEGFPYSLYTDIGDVRCDFPIHLAWIFP